MKRASRRRGIMVLSVVVCATALSVALGLAVPLGPDVTHSWSGPNAVAPAPTMAPVAYPEVGPGTYHTAAGSGRVLGDRGALLRFRVAVEDGIVELDAAAFAARVEQVYGDARGWTAGGQWRLQRVGPGQRADFVVYLVTPATRDALCEDGFDRYTSCRRGDRVVLNVARFLHGVPHYGAGRSVYQDYMINHETGHRLSFGHELCPGPGRPAPVMQQQTLGLHGCVANAWPYPNGHAYHGASGSYDGP